MSLLDRWRTLTKGEESKEPRDMEKPHETPRRDQDEEKEAPSLSPETEQDREKTSREANAQAPDGLEGEEGDFQDLLQRFEQIDDLIGDDDAEEAGDGMNAEVVLSLSASEALALIPAHFKNAAISAADVPDSRIEILVPDPLYQLAKGEVTVKLGVIVERLPRELFSAEVAAGAKEPVSLPLSRVVDAIPPDLLEAQVQSTPERELGLQAVPDPFSRVEPPSEAPGPEATAPSPEVPPAEAASSPDVPPEAPPEEPVAPAETEFESRREAEEPVPPRPEPVLEKPEPEAGLSEARPEAPRPAGAPVPSQAEVPFIMIRGVDINRAGRRDLIRNLPGVGPVLALRILAARPFRNVFELAEVEGVGRRMFFRMTGEHLPLSEAMAELVSEILGPADQPLPAMREIARRIASMQGINGCLLSHVDGNILAAASTNRRNKSFCAIAPQIMKSVDKYLTLLSFEPAQGLTLFLDPKPIYMTRAGNVYLVVTVPRTRFSLRRIGILENILFELVRRLQLHQIQDRPETPSRELPGKQD